MVRKLEEENVNKLDFTKFELDYILQNANFNDIQLRIFKRLTDKYGRQKIVKIAIEVQQINHGIMSMKTLVT